MAQPEDGSYSGLIRFSFSSFLPLFSHQCIDNEARKDGINDTLNLPDPTLQFIKLRPLMDQAIQPVGGKPLLVRKGAAFTHIVVNHVQAADGEQYHVMFIGTGGCWAAYTGQVHEFRLIKSLFVLDKRRARW